jgi:hypothetical protein
VTSPAEVRSAAVPNEIGQYATLEGSTDA